MSNVREATLSTKIPEARHVEVLAWDEMETRVVCREGKWVVVNKNYLYLPQENFTEAVTVLNQITGITDVGFAFKIYN